MQLTFILGLTLLYLTSFTLSEKDFYKVLGIEKSASDKEIKSAFRQLTLKYHPDKNPGDEAAHDKFLEIGEAYEILSDPEKRRNYDQFGDPNGQPQQHHFDFGDMFGNFFGGHHGGAHGQQQRQGKRKGDSSQLSLHIPLVDFYNGKIIEFDVEMQNECTACDGTGSKDKERKTCDKCHGTGQITVLHQLAPGMVQQIRMQCDACGGHGKVVSNPCGQCHGQGIMRGPRHYEIYVKPGQARDSPHVLEGEGDRNPNWIPGDLIVILNEQLEKSWGYRRIGDNLYRTEVLTLNESLHGGWLRKIQYFDTEEPELVLQRESGVPIMDGEVEIVRGKGMPIVAEHDEEERYGDLFVEYKVIIPGGVGGSQKKKGAEKDEL
ncbi:DnaJ-related protein SCJ1 [Candida viswanathii]|uniref:DnaJ-related protein SCJ1 n=1 Tax=Candida viswanathii TaxID=5486 RepID=A0A367XVS8_9ASCO|nr:DnaJ-related protein SCJ1 [Candida viswanathii]